MFRAITRIWLVAALLVLGGRSARAFSLLGPTNNEAFQTAPGGLVIGYNEGPPAFGVDVGTPKNIGEEYRINAPFLYYAADSTFLDWFGADGQSAVDQAFAVLNNTLTNVSSYSPALTEFPLNTTRFNFRADALHLLDVKSITLSLLLEQMGLADPERWVWCLHDRFIPAGAMCPNYEYVVIQRNYDPTTGTYSPFVNGTLYGYAIVENCGLNPNPFAPLLADAVEYPIDPLAPALTSVASTGFASQVPGGFVTGLTRDDVAGLRYLLSKTNLNVEPSETNSLLVVTNGLTTLVTSNLALLLSASVTNSGAQLQALFPGLVVTSSTLIGFSNVVTSTTGGFFVKDPFAPAGTPPRFVVTTTLATNLVQVFSNTFGNVVVVATNNQGTISVVANGVTNLIVTNQSGGEFIFVPSNQCGFSIISTNVGFAVTNITVNTTTITNGTTNTTVIGTVFTNHILAVAIPACVSNTVSLRQGIEKIHFFRQDFDSLLSQLWTPVTNTFTMTAVSNNAPVVQNFSRIITTPDVLLTAADLTPGPNTLPLGSDNARTAPVFARANAGNGLAGPGIIQPAGIVLVYNKVGPDFLLAGPGNNFLNGQSILTWGSFDGTTNAPVVYPDGTSIANLENQLFLQITVSGVLPAAQHNQFYTTTLTATGVEPQPYTWSLAPNSPGLPTGLHISSTGTISGSPLVTGVFDFIVQVQDDTGRTSQRNFAIQVNP